MPHNKSLYAILITHTVTTCFASKYIYAINFKVMKKSKEQIQKEKIAVYFGMIGVMKMHDVDYCQSWWLNTKNYNIGLTTPEINRRAKLLVKKGLLSIDKSKTSNSCGVCYRLIKFESIKVDDLTFDMLVLNILPNISKLIENSNSFRSIDTLQTE